MDYTERLRELIIDDARSDCDPDQASGSARLDTRTRCLVRLGALVAVSAAEPSLHREIDDARGAGVAAEEIVAVLDAVRPVVGKPRVVSAAPKVASALGEDLDLLDGYR